MAERTTATLEQVVSLARQLPPLVSTALPADVLSEIEAGD